MESHLGNRLPILVVLALLLSLGTGALPAAADDPPYTPGPVDVWVGTNPDAVTVDATTTGSRPGGNGTQASGGSAPRCILREIPMSDWDEDLLLGYYGHRMRYAPYYVVCDGQQQGIVWIEISLSDSGTSAARDPRDIAMELRDRMPIPRVMVEINPERGLVGAESWFWIQGYSGAPLTDSTDAFGDLVEVEATVTRYEWSFGDGATLVSDTPGQAYPARSEVRHVYERSSLGLPGGYPVEATFVFAVRYRVNGGAWIELPGITRLARADYPVRESQAVIRR